MTGYIRDEQRGASVSDIDIVVEIAAEPDVWHVPTANVQTVEKRFGLGQEALLECACLGHLGLEPLQGALVILTTPAQLETALDERQQNIAVERLLDEVERRTAQSPNELFVKIVEAAGHQDHVHVRKTRLQLRHQLEAVEIGHADVEDRELRFQLFGKR